MVRIAEVTRTTPSGGFVTEVLDLAKWWLDRQVDWWKASGDEPFPDSLLEESDEDRAAMALEYLRQDDEVVRIKECYADGRRFK